MSETLSVEELNEIIAGCKGVTPGEWTADGVKNDGFTSYEVTDQNGRSICDTYNAGAAEIIQEDGRPWDEQGRKNMAHIARLSPERVRSAFSELLAARKKLAKLEAALNQIAAWDDDLANQRLKLFGTYSSFDEPGSVQIARHALPSIPKGD